MNFAAPLAPAAQDFREIVVAEASRAAEAAQHVNMRIAGDDLRLVVADPGLGAALLPAIHHHEIPAAADPTRLIVGSFPLSQFPWGPENLGRGGAVAGLSQGPVRATAAADGSSLMLWDAGRRLACCWFAGLDGVRPWDRAAPLRNALHFALAGPHRQLLHGAVVGVDGRGALLAGPGGSGKSTTTLAAIHAGMQVVGDDYAAVELDGRRVQAWNLYCSVKVGERDGGPHGIDRRQTLIIGRDLPGTMTESLTLTTVLLPRITGSPVSSLTEASPAAALRALAPSTLLQAPHDDHPDMGLMVALARALPAYHLNLGADQGIPAIREALAL